MRTVDFDRNVDVLVRWGYGNRYIFKEGPCCWFRTRRCVLSSGIFSGRESASLNDRSCFRRFWCVLLFLLKMCWNIVECGCRLSETFCCPQKFDSCSSCATRGSIICITRFRICIFSNSSAFRILSNSITQNEIMRTGAFTDNYLNQMICSDCRRMWFGNCWNPIGS